MTTTSAARRNPSSFASQRAPRDLRHRHRLEIRAQERELVELAADGAARRLVRRAHGDLLAAAAARQQPDARFDEPDVRLERGDRAVAVQDEFARAAERHAAHGGDRRHEAVAQAQRRLLELRDDMLRSSLHCPACESRARSTPGWRRARTAPSSARGRAPRTRARRARSPPACRRAPSSPIVFALLLNDTIATSSPRCHMRTAGGLHDRRARRATSRPAPDRETPGADRPAASSAARRHSRTRLYAPAGVCTPVAAGPARDPRRQRHASRASCRRRCPRRSSRRRPSSPPPARSRTAPSPSRSPSEARGRRRARCRRSPRGGRRSSGRDRGRSPTGIAPADAGCARSLREFFARRLEREDLGHGRVDDPFAPCDRRALPGRAPRCPCRPCGRSRPASSARARPARSAREHRRRVEQRMPRIVGQRVVHRPDHVRHRVEARRRRRCGTWRSSRGRSPDRSARRRRRSRACRSRCAPSSPASRRCRRGWR